MISLISPSEVKYPTSIAIGSFDGLHAGHRQLIKSVVEENQYTPTIASFWPHPREVLYKETRLRLDLPYEDIDAEYGMIRKIVLWAAHDGITADPTISKMFDDEVKNRMLQKEIARIDPVVVETMQEAVNAYAPDVRKDVVIFASALVKKAIHGVNDDDATSNDINNYAKAVQTVTDTLEVTQRHSAGINVNGASSVQVQGFEFVLDTPPEKDVIDVTHEESDNG